jgi:hypothetical protein
MSSNDAAGSRLAALRRIHRQLQKALVELIENKNYSAAEHLLLVVDKQMVDLIEAAGGVVQQRVR